jgi:hypothetical protein
MDSECIAFVAVYVGVLVLLTAASTQAAQYGTADEAKAGEQNVGMLHPPLSGPVKKGPARFALCWGRLFCWRDLGRAYSIWCPLGRLPIERFFGLLVRVAGCSP